MLFWKYVRPAIRETVNIDDKFVIYSADFEPTYYGRVFSAHATKLVKAKDYLGALNAYSMAIVYCTPRKALSGFLSNRALIYENLEK